MDKYQGKNLDRYQEEIKKAAAKGVKDLNLNGNITPSLPSYSKSHYAKSLPKSSGSYINSNGGINGRTQNMEALSNLPNSVQSSISVSAAAAKFENLQKLNQINVSNGNATKTPAHLIQNGNVQSDNNDRRKSTGPLMATMLPNTREPLGTNSLNKFISKSNSASSILQQLNNGNQIIRTTNPVSAASNGGVIADFAFGNSDNVSNNVNDKPNHVSNRVSPLTLNQCTNQPDQVTSSQVHQLAARFNQVVSASTMNGNHNQSQQKGVVVNSSNNSSRQSSVSPFPTTRVSPGPNTTTVQLSSTTLPSVVGITIDQTNQQYLSNGSQITNQNIRDQVIIKFSTKSRSNTVAFNFYEREN